MELTELFESLDEKIFTPDMKDKLVKIFESEVESRAEAKAIELTEAKVEELKSELQESVNAELDNKINSITESLDEYLNLVVEKMLSENQKVNEAEENKAKVDALLEAFEALVATAGKDIKSVISSADLNEDIGDVDYEAKINELVKDNITLKKMNAELAKSGVIAELTADLTVVQKAQVEKLADLVEFSHENYNDSINKIVDIVEMIKQKQSETQEKGDSVNESKTNAEKIYAQFI